MHTAQKVHIAYDDIGEGAPAVVLLHGLFEDRSYCAEVAAHLARRHRVLNLDLRGHGESEVPAEGYSLHQLVQALDTPGWREALLGFFSGVAGPSADRVCKDMLAAPRVYAAAMLRDIAAASTTVHGAELAGLSCPLLYVHSGMPLDLDRLRELQPALIVEAIPEAGHYVMLTAPDQVNSALDRFLEVIG